jgi:peptide/nickel transport system permease protein
MTQYVIKRVLLFVPTIIFASILIFLLMRLIPGDPALLRLVGDTGATEWTQEDLDRERQRLGTDRWLPLQYVFWAGNMLKGDFGESMFYDTPVSEDLVDRLPVTVQLTVMGLALAIVVSVPLGVLSAVRQDTWIDYVSRMFTITGIALPTFLTGILIVYFLSVIFNWSSPLNYQMIWENPWMNLKQMFLPAIALGLYDSCFIARVTRSAVLEVFREDYIRTARSKGLAERLVIYRHALKNAFLPIITVVGWQFGRILSGTVIIENIFVVPGMGGLLIFSILHRDYTTIQAVIVLVTVMVLIVNLTVDLLYAWLDPRIRYA